MSKAEGILLLVKSALKNGDTAEKLQKTMADFYRLIPHKHPASEEIDLRLLAQKEDLCQVCPWNTEFSLNVSQGHVFKLW